MTDRPTDQVDYILNAYYEIGADKNHVFLKIIHIDHFYIFRIIDRIR